MDYCFVLLKKIFISITGEKLTNDQVDELFDDCLDEEDDDGMIPYDRKYSWSC